MECLTCIITSGFQTFPMHSSTEELNFPYAQYISNIGAVHRNPTTTNMKSTILLCLVLFTAVLASEENGVLPRCWTLLFCDRGTRKKPEYSVVESETPQEVKHGNCTKKQMMGKVSGRFHTNFANIWPIDAENVDNLKSVYQHIYRCSENTTLTVGNESCTTSVHGITVEVCFERKK